MGSSCTKNYSKLSGRTSFLLMMMFLFAIACSIPFGNARKEHIMQAREDKLHQPLEALASTMLAVSNPALASRKTFNRGERLPRAIRSAASIRPQPTMSAPTPLDEAMILLSKSAETKLFESIVIAFPFAFTGAAIGALVREIVLREGISEDEVLTFALLPIFAALLVGFGFTPVLIDTTERILAEGGIRFYNLFTDALLPGASLKI